MAQIAVIETGYVGLSRYPNVNVPSVHDVSENWVGEKVSLEVVTQLSTSKIELEVRNLFGRNAWKEVGFMYKGVGR